MKRWLVCFRSTSACRAISRGKAGRSTPASGRRPSRAGAWCGASTSTATVRAIWRGTAASIGPSSSIRSTPIAIWEKQLGRTDLSYGQFGENFTVEGLPDDEVCIGDRYPDRGCRVRSDAAARHLLPGRHPHERAADGRPARRARQARLLLSRHRGRRGRRRRRDRAGRGRARAHDRSPRSMRCCTSPVIPGTSSSRRCASPR